MHAWVRAWCGWQTGWIEYDPTNAQRRRHRPHPGRPRPRLRRRGAGQGRAAHRRRAEDRARRRRGARSRLNTCQGGADVPLHPRRAAPRRARLRRPRLRPGRAGARSHLGDRRARRRHRARLHDRHRQPAGDPGRPRRAGRRRLRRRCRDRGADGAEPGRAAELRPRRRRLRALLGRRPRPARQLRRPRDRPRRRHPRLLARRRRPAARVLGRGGRRPLRRRPRHAEADGDAAPALWPPALGRAVRAGDRAGRGRLPDLAAPRRRHRRRPGAPPRRLPGRERALPAPGRQPQGARARS